jgi:mannan endo-1,4-beta-mannosidase
MHPRLPLFAGILLCIVSGASASDSLAHFITRRGDTLFNGAEEFRFISFNIPNLHLLEDDFAFTATNNWSLPGSFELRDAMESVRQAGGTVIRLYCLRIHKKREPGFLPQHLTAWRTYYDPAFRVLDTAIALANEYGIRLIIPFLEGPPWWGPKHQFARLRKGLHCFESPEVKEDFRHLAGYLLNRRNTVTGTVYKDDKAILCWETGNEMSTSAAWLSEMAAFIKSIDGRHLVMDGNYGVRTAALSDPNVDIVSNHLYKKPAACITRDLARIKGRKAYIVGEWGWTKEKAREVIRRTVNSRAAGALIWSLRPRYRGGGFTWHKGEGLHWPGGFFRSELDDEQEILAMVRQGAYTISGSELPPFPPPKPPVLLPINHPSAISWQGSAGATRYSVERSGTADGPWTTAGDSVDETVIAYRPLFCDTAVAVGDTWYYRIIARGPGGTSLPSNIRGPVSVSRLTLVDELVPGRERFAAHRGTRFTADNPWRYKYDFHRRRGTGGDYLEYRVDGSITGIRVYAFFSGRVSDFHVVVSGDTAGWTSVIVRATEYAYCCANPHDRLRLPVLFSAAAVPSGNNRVRIIFPQGGAEAGRCEVDYIR